MSDEKPPPHPLADPNFRDQRSLYLEDWATLVRPFQDDAHRFVGHSATYGSTALQAADIIRKAPARIVAGSPTPASESVLSFIYAFVGTPERFLDAQERTVDAGSCITSVASFTAWHPSLSAMRKTAQFKALVRKMGLVDYWRAKGWPDLCHPTTGDDFACD